MDRLRAAASPAELPPPRPRAAARLVNVILDPLAAFRDIDASPTWALAFVALTALRFGSLFVFYRPEVSPLKLVAGVLFQVLTVAPAVVVLALGLWAVAKFWRARLSWSSALSVTVHALFAYTLATVLVASIAGAVLPASVEVDLRNPPFTNLAFVAGAQTPAVMRRLLAAADVRVAYAFVLAYLGVAAASSAPGVPAGGRRRAAGAVATGVAVHVLATVGATLARG